eukprot:362046_1
MKILLNECSVSVNSSLPKIDLSMEMVEKETFGSLKRRVFEEHNVSLHGLTLFYKGRPVGDGSTVSLVVAGDSCPEIRIDSRSEIRKNGIPAVLNVPGEEILLKVPPPLLHLGSAPVTPTAANLYARRQRGEPPLSEHSSRRTSRRFSHSGPAGGAESRRPPPVGRSQSATFGGFPPVFSESNSNPFDEVEESLADSTFLQNRSNTTEKVPKSAPSRTSTDVVEEAKKRLCETKLELRSAGKGCDAVKELCESLISQMQKATLELDTIRNATANHRHQKELLETRLNRLLTELESEKSEREVRFAREAEENFILRKQCYEAEEKLKYERDLTEKTLAPIQTENKHLRKRILNAENALQGRN